MILDLLYRQRLLDKEKNEKQLSDMEEPIPSPNKKGKNILNPIENIPMESGKKAE